MTGGFWVQLDSKFPCIREDIITIIGYGPYYVESYERAEVGRWIYRINGKAFSPSNFRRLDYASVIDWEKEGF